MASKGVSITAEETIETTMRQMLDAGLPSYGDVNFTNYLEFTGAYEELNDVRTHKIDDASLAHQFKRLIVSLGPTFNQSILLRIALLEGECRARGEDPNDDPVWLSSTKPRSKMRRTRSSSSRSSKDARSWAPASTHSATSAARRPAVRRGQPKLERPGDAHVGNA